MTIRSAEEAKEIIKRFKERGYGVPGNIEERADQYLQTLEGPEVTELVEAASIVVKINPGRFPVLESALAKIEECRK